MMKFLEKYYPILLAFLSFLYSIYLWFSGNELEGIYVGLWPITILGFAIAIRQRRKDNQFEIMQNKLMFIIGILIFIVYIYFYIRIVIFGSSKRDNNKNNPQAYLHLLTRQFLIPLNTNNGHLKKNLPYFFLDLDCFSFV